MNFLISSMNLILNNLVLTFVIIVALGFAWIYFQIPKIKKETKPVIPDQLDYNDLLRTTSKYGARFTFYGVLATTTVFLFLKGEPEQVLLTSMTCGVTIFGLAGFTFFYFILLNKKMKQAKNKQISTKEMK
mgnify:CR=1 FL=1